jgi:transcriptional regulator
MVLTREEREKRILDLYNQGYNTRTIAQETHTSFRDIGVILKRAAQQREIGQAKVERTSISTQAYRLFSEGKAALQVAIDLQIKSDEAIKKST